ncbi:unnamed protein product [Soboliphyme baturini]|uniref:Protein pellino n=1 Tax=Soboliphyme baturini TaxID=241478 RepID=A0A183IB47_9BILA|nr:unnamed protein product [Soboliphyme baturini]
MEAFVKCNNSECLTQPRYNNIDGTDHVNGCRSRFELFRRAHPNGITKSRQYTVKDSKNLPAVRNRSQHSVTYTLSRKETVIVEYAKDEKTDMFQIGRSSEQQIDFMVVDTWLGRSFVNNSFGPQEKLPPSTISRYACRLLIDRSPAYTARVFAAGFDSSRNIFLGERATKWVKKSGETDGLTTNGILILHPQKDSSNDSQFCKWYEVSVDGEIYSLRKPRSSTERGDKVEGEANILQDGTLIDLCGATLLYRTAFGLANSPTLKDLEHCLQLLNDGRPQCPVSFNTLIIPKQKASVTTITETQPYVYISCGHVQGYHTWGHSCNDVPKHVCPSSEIVQLCMGMEPCFHLDSESFEYAFLPCGHMASKRTVSYWSKIPMPHGTDSFYPKF